MNKNQAAVCEVELKNGDVCSIPRLAVALPCGRAFCASHQAWCFCQVNCEPIFDRNSHQFQREAGERRNENGTIFQLKSEPAFAMDINDN